MAIGCGNDGKPEDACVFNLKPARKRKGMTQSALARAVGVTPNTIWQLEKGLINPSWQLACDIAKVLEVSLDELVDSANAKGAKNERQ